MQNEVQALELAVLERIRVLAVVLALVVLECIHVLVVVVLALVVLECIHVLLVVLAPSVYTCTWAAICVCPHWHFLYYVVVDVDYCENIAAS